MTQPLLRVLTHHNYLRERLEAEFPEADEDTLRDTLEGMTNLTEMLAEVLRSALEDQSFGAALRARIGDMQTRLSRLAHSEAKRPLIPIQNGH